MKQEKDFPTTNKYTKEDVKKVQKKLLEMAEIITKILEKHNIKYIIAFGTLLGAVRHKGFIPWDDDFDILLFKNEYDKALEILRKELPKDIIIQDKLRDKKYCPYWSRARDTKSETYSELYPIDNKYKDTGINVDLYYFEEIYEKDKMKKRYWHLKEYNKRKRKAGLMKKGYYKSQLKIYPKYIKEIIKANFSKNKNKIYFFSGIKVYTSTKEEIFPFKKYKFEDKYFFGPNNYDSMLKKIYNNYNIIPEYEKRNVHYTWVKFKDDEKK